MHRKEGRQGCCQWAIAFAAMVERVGSGRGCPKRKGTRQAMLDGGVVACFYPERRFGWEPSILLFLS